MVNQKVTRVGDSLSVRPEVPNELVKKIAFDCFGLTLEGAITELVSYSDRNFLLTGSLNSCSRKKFGRKFILKVFNADITPQKPFMNFCYSVLLKCSDMCKQHFQLPCFVCDLQNTTILPVYDIPLQKGFELDNDVSLNDLGMGADGRYEVTHMCRLSVFIEGDQLDVEKMSAQLSFSYGKSIALLSEAMKIHPAPMKPRLNGCFLWDIIQAPHNLSSFYISELEDENIRKICTRTFQRLEAKLSQNLHKLSKQWIHADLNEHNILQNETRTFVAGIIDFDDMLYSYRVVDIATALAYVIAVLPRQEGFLKANRVFKGYASVCSFDEAEMNLLYALVLTRLCMSISLSNYNRLYVDPTNDYVAYHAKKGRSALIYLDGVGEEYFLEKILK